MIIEIKKKHIIVTTICIIIGIVIGAGGVFLIQQIKDNGQSTKEVTSTTQVSTNEISRDENVSSNLSDKKDGDLTFYKNGRYGFSVRYPSNWIKGTPPANGDGLVISPQDGTIEMHIFGSNNVLNKTVYNEYNHALSNAYESGIPGFHMVSDDWYVVTYTDGTFIYYIKGFVGKGSINTLRIKYLQSMKDQYQATIQQLEGSFNHGNLEIGH